MDITSQVAMLNSILLPPSLLEETRRGGALDPEARTRLNSYLVLSHAVIEEFLEEMTLDRYDRITAGVLSGAMDSSLASLYSWVSRIAGKDAKSINLTFEDFDLHRQLLKWRPIVEKGVRSNHGIKKANVKGLAKLCGMSWQVIDSTLATKLDDLDALGAMRGQAGHLSPFSRQGLSLSESPDSVIATVSNAANAALSLEELFVA